MKTIIDSFHIVHRTIQKDLPLGKITKEYFTEHMRVKDERKVIRSLTACTFKNFLVFRKIIKDCFSDVKKMDEIIISVGLADLIFIKSTPAEENLEIIKGLLDSNKSFISYDMLTRLYYTLPNQESIIPSTVNPESNEYLSLKYNLPEWLIEMWNHHYGQKVAQLQIEAQGKPSIQTMRVNRAKASRLNLLNTYKDLLAGGVSLTTVNYTQRKPLRFLTAIDEGKLILIPEAVNHITNISNLRSKDSILVVDNAKSNLYLTIAEETNDKANVILYRPNDADRIEANKMIERYGFNSVKSESGTLTSLITLVEPESKDFVYSQPGSSNFNAISGTPDFFIHFDKKDFDKIILAEKEHLDECSKFVRVGGQLVYVVQTANNKEGTLVVQSFLKTHPNFKMISDSQRMQFDRRHTSVYYAFLKREKTDLEEVRKTGK